MERKNWKNKTEEIFLKTAAVLGTTIAGVSTNKTKAEAKNNILSEDRMGVLVDTTTCIGCRNCEWGCKKAHDLPSGNIENYSDRSVFKHMRRPDTKALTVVNEYDNPQNSGIPINVKVQCMHCDHPACVSACIEGAFSKNENGAVTWNTKKCIGCRYCMVACPFQVPAFEYDKAINPEIKKCDFCFERTKVGKLPACVEICPVEALTYGSRTDLIKVARNRIKRNPEKYVNHIYGEYEVGGTSWLYIASEEFQKLAFPKLSEKPAPGVSDRFNMEYLPILYLLLPSMLFLED